MLSQEKNIAVLDLGTNTFHLQVARRAGSSIQTLYKLQIPVKLGEGGINQGFINEAAYQRGMLALLTFAADVKNYPVDIWKAFATSAIRDASNGAAFLAEAKERTGFVIETITGDEEARYICEGVRHSLPFGDEPWLVMDIGGGSVEFIIASSDKVFWKQSFKIGAARLIEKYHQHDPMGIDERNALYDFLTDHLAPLWNALRQYHVPLLVGSAGSFESVVELTEDLLKKGVAKHSDFSYLVPLPDYYAVHQRLLQSTMEQRMQMKGLVSFRVEMMVAASCLIDVVLKQSGIQKMIASEYSLKEGMIFSL